MAILSYVHEIQTVYNVVHNPQMILLSESGAHGVSSRCEKVGMLLPQRSYHSHNGSTLNMLFITNSTTVASHTNPAGPVHMASTSQTASYEKPSSSRDSKCGYWYLTQVFSHVLGQKLPPFLLVLKSLL